MFSPSRIAYQVRRIVGRQSKALPTIEYQGIVIYRLPPPLSDRPSCLMFTQPKFFKDELEFFGYPVC
jgi:hypothetical protein